MTAAVSKTRPLPPHAELVRTNRRIDVRSRGLARALAPWLRRFAMAEARRAAQSPYAYAGPLTVVAKEQEQDEQDTDARALEMQLRTLLLRFGLRAAADAANGAAGEILIPESIQREASEGKPARIKWFWEMQRGIARRAHDIQESTREEARASVKRIVLASLDERPRPSTGEIARRISNAFLGPGEEARDRRVHSREGGEGPRYTLSDRSRRDNEVLVRIDVAALDRAWRKDPDFYVGRGGKGGIEGRYENSLRFVRDAESLHASQVSVDEDGIPRFVDGRHRFAALRDMGVRAISVAVPVGEADELYRRFGSKMQAPGERALIFSPERAELIARTELGQAENAGIYAGYVETGVDEIEWLGYRDGRSGQRQHDRMVGVRVKVGEMFVLPSGVRLRHPGDMDAPIGETVNCRCTTRGHRARKRG